MQFHRHIILLVFLLISGEKLVAQNTIAVWHLDENDGLITIEEIGNGFFSVKNDFPTMESERMEGVFGKSLRFNGYATWVEGNLSTALPVQQITISAWVAPEVVPFSPAAFFTNVSGNTGAFLGIDNFGRLQIGATVNGVFSQKISSEKIPIYEWSLVALTVDPSAGKMRGYLNGILVAEQIIQNGSLNWLANAPVSIGKHHASPVEGIFESGLFCGLLDEVKIYDSALSQSALSVIYQNEKPGNAPNMAIPASRFQEDTHRPIFHAIPPANWMNEPHGLFFHAGLYHIFYQKNGNGPYWGRLNWGHQTSPDLVVWTEQPVALSPDPGGYDREGCWSGCAVMKDGNPYLMYTGVDGGSAQICLAEGNADATVFSKFQGNPVVATPPAPYTSNDFRDPFIWQENDDFYMIIGSGLGNLGQSGGAALLYKSADLTTWQYLDVLHKGFPATDNSGIFWEVPMFLKFGDKYVFTAQPVPQSGSPARVLYWTGSFANEQFSADSIKPKLLEPGDNLLGVTTLTHPNAADKYIAVGIIPDILPAGEQQENGWANLMSLPREWSLSPDGRTLKQKPLPALEKLRDTNHHFENVAVAAGQNGFLPNLSGRHLEIQAKIDPGTATRVGLVLAKSDDNSERTRIYWEVPFDILQIERSNSSVNVSAPKGNVSTNFSGNEPSIDLHIFLDGSVLEVFINETEALSTRIFPEKPSSIGLDLFTQGGTAIFQSIDIWEMKDMHDPTVSGVQTPVIPAKNAIENVFPNPSSGSATLQLMLENGGETKVKVVDFLGKIIREIDLGYLNSGAHTQTLDIESPSELGWYFVSIWQTGMPIGGIKFMKFKKI